MPAAEVRLHAFDWTIIGGYLVLVVVVGLLVRRRAAGDEFFLGGRSIPWWAVAISLLATTQSAATFVGGPEQAYRGDLTYLASNLGGLIAILIVAFLFIPAYYRLGVTSVYELVGDRFGLTAQRAASGMFMTGRVFASGARLYIVALPFSLVAFGDVNATTMIVTIAVLAAVATTYTLLGGIRAVIWTDVLQATIYIGTVAIALALLWQAIPMSGGEVLDALWQSEDRDKLVVIDDDLFSFTRSYTLPAVVIGLTLFMLAAFGADQDLAQRLLTCRDANQGKTAAIVSTVIGWPVVLLFLAMGLLLHVYFNRPDIMGAALPEYRPDDSRKVFLEYMLREMGPGLRGLALAGLLAAAMSSMDSALNAMASTTVADFYRPWRARRGVEQDAASELVVSRRAVIGWAVLLAVFASICVWWQQASGESLIDFALGVMVFAYSGLLAVFMTALLTRRGNAASVGAALATGLIVTGLLHPTVWPQVSGAEWSFAFPWRMTIATVMSFVVCVAARRDQP